MVCPSARNCHPNRQQILTESQLGVKQNPGEWRRSFSCCSGVSGVKSRSKTPPMTAVGLCVPGKGVCCSGRSVWPWNGKAGGCCTHGHAQTQQKLFLGCSCWPNLTKSGSQSVPKEREMNIQQSSTPKVPRKPRKMKTEGGGDLSCISCPMESSPTCLGGLLGGTAPKPLRGDQHPNP